MPAALQALHRIVRRGGLSEAEASEVMAEILDGRVSPAVIGALLTALSMKGETVDEIVGFARAMRAHANPVRVPPGDAAGLVDTCGTGGDGLRTFNISTVAAFVAAGAGARVAKHGNRSISSHCGSADVLEGAGARVELSAEQAAQAIDTVGIGFLFAPLIHPAMRHAQPVRRELKMRTVFNILGPLTNPAGASAQVLGVFERALTPLLAEALLRLGVRRAFVVHGADGLDEITTTAETHAAEVTQGRVVERTLTPEEFGVPRARPEDLRAADRDANVAALRAVLAGEHGPRRDIVVVNAAAALVAAGIAAGFREGVEMARASVDSGSARRKLEQFVEFTQRQAAA